MVKFNLMAGKRLRVECSSVSMPNLFVPLLLAAVVFAQTSAPEIPPSDVVRGGSIAWPLAIPKACSSTACAPMEAQLFPEALHT